VLHNFCIEAGELWNDDDDEEMMTMFLSEMGMVMVRI